MKTFSFYLFLIVFEFSLDDFLCSLITNESENSFQHYQHIILCGSVFVEFWDFHFFIVVPAWKDTSLKRVNIPSKNITYCIIIFLQHFFLFMLQKFCTSKIFGGWWKAIFLTFLFYNLPFLCLGKLLIGIKSHYMVTINYIIGFPTGL